MYTIISDFYYKERLLLTQFKTLDELLEFCTKQGFVKAMETVDFAKAGLYIRMARPEVLTKMKRAALSLNWSNKILASI